MVREGAGVCKRRNLRCVHVRLLGFPYSQASGHGIVSRGASQLFRLVWTRLKA